MRWSFLSVQRSEHSQRRGSAELRSHPNTDARARVASQVWTHRSTWTRHSFALIVQYATVNEINIYMRFFWEMSPVQICSLASELIVGSLNVNDTIRARLEPPQHGAASRTRPPARKQRSDSKKIAFVTNTVPHSSILLAKLRHSLSSLPMDVASSAWSFIFLDSLLPIPLFLPLPLRMIPLFSIFSRVSLLTLWYLCACDAAWMSPSCFCSRAVHWKMLSSSVTMEAAHSLNTAICFPLLFVVGAALLRLMRHCLIRGEPTTSISEADCDRTPSEYYNINFDNRSSAEMFIYSFFFKFLSNIFLAVNIS